MQVSQTENTNQMANEVVVTLNGQDVRVPLESLGLTFDAPDRDILAAVNGIIREQQGVDLNDDDGEVAYTVRKATNSHTVYVYPKPVAG